MLSHSPRRAKIVCTLGPASDTPEMIGSLVDAGMNAARLNFSHGTHEDHARVYETVRSEASRRGVAVAVLADLQGPKLRVGKIPPPGILLTKGQHFVLSVDPEASVDASRATVTYQPLAREVFPGTRILLDDGVLELQVDRIDGPEIVTTVVQGGVLTSNKGVNVPGAALSVPALTDKDIDDLRFSLELGVDAIALSFVRRAGDIEAAKKLMAEIGRERPIIAKIEKPEGVENLQSILDVADGIMVARGDLGVEAGPEAVPMIQKRAIQLANQRGKLVITATQMLESMVHNARPTRAEASDVANAVLDGSDVLMLSGETARGDHPRLVVETMNKIIVRTEQAEQYWRDRSGTIDLGTATNAIAEAAVTCCRSIRNARAIAVYTGSGGIARLVSDYRPRVPIYAFTPNPVTYQALALYWGVTPQLFSPSSLAGESIFNDLDRALLDRRLVPHGDIVVFATGYPVKAKTSVNLLKIHQVGETLPGTAPP